ncbi:unnamed protein product (macronuclear) [Paramecium tetraurelia]|uniref:Uncharacterized protein n=1 Tax=Paramecium tetraurelia TaxID=5888 RepID=A0EAK9_PARTE|nr:uncharacterized protein GSPATT00025060001 [Paramecium tetraurelia]CAK92326.1 unnamed protein product [Paramecium tetraurelia]|eukprot:XP_001459723.1 hypothetical protein (macronuclear) [Paramecium tetraurelia strain d4-2]
MSKKQNSQSTPEILQYKVRPQNHYQIEQLVLNDMKKKILNDEMNSIQFYDIIQPDMVFLIHIQNEIVATNPKDLTKKPIKLHKKVKRSDLESNLRNKLINEPGGKLLLQEIYEILDEDDMTQQVKPVLHKEEQFKGNTQYKQESDDLMVANLDQWWKQVKVKKQQEFEKKQLELEKEKQVIAQIQKAVSISSLRRGAVDKRTNTTILPAFPKLMQSQSSDDKSPKTESQTLFQAKIKGSLAKLSNQKKAELLHQDIGLVKQLDKYHQQGSTLTQQELINIEQARQKQSHEEKQTDTLIFDYTVEGLKNSLHTRIKMNLTHFLNANERAVFYEKQTQSILQQINSKLDKQKKIVGKNERDLENLRMENHEIYNRLRSIENIQKQLKEELGNVGNNNNNQVQKSNKSSNVDFYMASVGKQNEIDSQLETMKDSYKKYKIQIQLNFKQIEKLEAENSKLNKNNKELLKSIQGFLQELLKIGLDCRKQGLSWIIKAIWDTNEKLRDENFPSYLDSKGREFLILKAKKMVELNDLFIRAHQLFGSYHGRLETSQDNLNNSILSILSKNHFSQIDSEEIKNKTLRERRMKSSGEINLLLKGLNREEKQCVQGTLTSIFQSKQTLNDIIYTEAQKKIQKMFKTETSMALEQSFIAEDKERLIREYQQIQQDIEAKEIMFKKFEDLELQRIVKEIDYKKYLHRFSVEPLQVLSALFGYV